MSQILPLYSHSMTQALQERGIEVTGNQLAIKDVTKLEEYIKTKLSSESTAVEQARQNISKYIKEFNDRRYWEPGMRGILRWGSIEWKIDSLILEAKSHLQKVSVIPTIQNIALPTSTTPPENTPQRITQVSPQNNGMTTVWWAIRAIWSRQNELNKI